MSIQAVDSPGILYYIQEISLVLLDHPTPIYTLPLLHPTYTAYHEITGTKRPWDENTGIRCVNSNQQEIQYFTM